MKCNDNLVAPKKQNNDDAKTNKNTLNTLIILNYVHAIENDMYPNRTRCFNYTEWKIFRLQKKRSVSIFN